MIYDYKDMDVFKLAREVTNTVYEITSEGQFSKDYPLRDQIRRSSISIMSNIAEGSGRGTRKENKNFLSIARGSCCELQSQLMIAYDQQYIPETEYDILDDKCDHLTKMFTKLINYMKYGKQAEN